LIVVFVRVSSVFIRGSLWVYAFQHGLTNEDVVAGFVGSSEYVDRTARFENAAWWLTSAYQDVLGRTPSDAECLAWVGTVRGAESPL
jgi:hypothetical protein